MAVNKIPTSGKSVREEELENIVATMQEEQKNQEANNYIQRLGEDSFYKLEMLRAFNRLADAVENLPQKVLELQQPVQEPTGE